MTSATTCHEHTGVCARIDNSEHAWERVEKKVDWMIRTALVSIAGWLALAAFEGWRHLSADAAARHALTEGWQAAINLGWGGFQAAVLALVRRA